MFVKKKGSKGSGWSIKKKEWCDYDLNMLYACMKLSKSKYKIIWKESGLSFFYIFSFSYILYKKDVRELKRWWVKLPVSACGLKLDPQSPHKKQVSWYTL